MQEKIIDNENTEKVQNNKYSIYDYLKNTPAILIAAISAMVAIVTFFAKFITLILSRKELVFWEVGSSYATFGSESIIYTVIFAILYSFLVTITIMLFTSIYEAFLQHQKGCILAKLFLKEEKYNIKRITKKTKRGKDTETEKAYLESIGKIREGTKEVKISTCKKFFFSFFVIFIIICVSSLLLAMIGDNSGDEFWMVAVTLLIFQLFSLWVNKIFIKKSTIKKKELRKECKDVNLVIKALKEQNNSDSPFEQMFRGGFRFVLYNSNIILIVVTVLLNCFTLSCMSSLSKYNPIKNSKTFQTTTIEDVQYAIVYHDGDKYYLEESEVKFEESEGEKPKKILVVYTNRQRIITCDDIVIEVEKYDHIIKEHKSDNHQDNQKNK